jgi:hypothetical protein
VLGDRSEKGWVSILEREREKKVSFLCPKKIEKATTYYVGSKLPCANLYST